MTLAPSTARVTQQLFFFSSNQQANTDYTEVRKEWQYFMEKNVKFFFTIEPPKIWCFSFGYEISLHWEGEKTNMFN